MSRLALLLLSLLLISGCSGGGERRATPIPSEGAEAAPTETAGPGQATPEHAERSYFPNAVELKAGDPVALPAGVVLYARDGLWEGAAGNLSRYYIDASGALRTDHLFVSNHGAEPRALLGAFAGENGELWARICHGTCYGGSEPVTMRNSPDGGITWADVFESSNQGPWMIAPDGDDLILGERNPNQELFLIRK